MLDQNTMWRAVADCDSTYDGQFFYGVESVGVYCRPSCKSKTPLEKNVLYFTDKYAAHAAGFRPCKRCRPDLAVYAPGLELARQAKHLVDNYYTQHEKPALQMKNLGVSANHLSVIFKQHYGLTPIEYLSKNRFEHAADLLLQTDMPIIQIGMEAGFESLSAFYAFFKKHSGTTPKKYRTQGGKT